jgi:hypothetical protein
MDDLAQLAELIRRRNALGREITQIIGRPSLIGHLGEYIASRVFNIALEASAVNKGFDGRFCAGPLSGKSVNVKWYAKKEGLLDIRVDAVPDFYMVLTGPQTKVLHSRGEDRPWLIDFAYLFKAASLIENLRLKQLKLGVATSVSKDLWHAAEVFPNGRNSSLTLTTGQCSMLSLFSSAPCNDE